MLAETAAGALRGTTTWPEDDFDDRWQEAWKKLDTLGLLHLFSEGASVLDAVVVHEEAGRALFGGPLPAAHGADYVLRYATSDTPQPSEPGLLLAGSSSDVRATQGPEGMTVSGRVTLSSAPKGASWLVWARGDERLLRLDDSALNTDDASPSHAFDTSRRHYVCTAAHAPAEPMPALSWSAAATVDDVVSLFFCADSVGAIDRALSMTADYARTRETFGSPIARNQAVAFPLVRHTLKLREMRLLTHRAAEALDGDEDDAHALALAARTLVATHGVDMISDCIQLTGAIGFTWEWGLHHLMRRVSVDISSMGGAHSVRAQLAATFAWATT